MPPQPACIAIFAHIVGQSKTLPQINSVSPKFIVESSKQRVEYTRQLYTVKSCLGTWTLFFFFLYFLQLYCPTGNSPTEKPGCLHRGKPAATGSRHTNYGACWVFQCFHNPPNSDMNYEIFNVHTDVNACDCTRGMYGHRKRVCTESWLWDKNPLPHRGIEPASATFRSDALTN